MLVLGFLVSIDLQVSFAAAAPAKVTLGNTTIQTANIIEFVADFITASCVRFGSIADIIITFYHSWLPVAASRLKADTGLVVLLRDNYNLPHFLPFTKIPHGFGCLFEGKRFINDRRYFTGFNKLGEAMQVMVGLKD